MSERLTCEPERLQRAREHLLRRSSDPDRELARIEALAECNFRLAVHPETPFPQAVELLKEAVRLDGTNPRYAYHLGRLYFLHGQLDRAGTWFRLACCLSPTSHRVWTHVSLLQQELNRRYVGDDRFEPNALLKRSQAIADAIRQGADALDADLLDLVPPKSLAEREREQRQGRSGGDDRESGNGWVEHDGLELPTSVRRFLDPGRCRWPGIDHLLVEQMLAARPSQTNLRRMMPLFEAIARRAGRRPGSFAAFVILAVEWLVCGYPVQTVRRLQGMLPEATRGCLSLDLLETVCRLFEVDRAELPGELARAVMQGRVPALLAAVIHQRRLLADPLEYRELNSYRAARALLATGRSRATNAPATVPDDDKAALAESARSLEKDLRRALETFTRPPAAPRVKDEPAKVRKQESGTPSASVTERLDALEQAARRLAEIRDEAFRFLKERMDAPSAGTDDPALLAQVAADRAAFDQLLQLLQATAEEALARLEALGRDMASHSADTASTDWAQRREACTGAFQDSCQFGNFRRVLRRIDRRLAAVEDPLPDDQPASAELSALLAAAGSVLEQATSNSGAEDSGGSTTGGEAGAPAETAADLIAMAAPFETRIEQLWVRLKELDQLRRDDKLSSAHLEELQAAREEFERITEQADSALPRLIAQREEGVLPAELISAAEEAETRFRRVLQARGRFRRLWNRFGSLKAPDRTPQGPPEARDEPSATSPERPSSATKGDNAATQAASTAESATGESSPLAALEAVVARTDHVVDEAFAAAEATLDAYPEWMRLLPPFQALRGSIRARHAETLYRLGRRRQARRIWNRMLRDDRLDANVLKNIAVCDTMEGDPARSLAAWRSYLELLYVYDIIGGDLSAHARQRVEFHRAFGDGFGPGFLSAPFDAEWSKSVNAQALVAFLSSPGRVRNFIDHRLVEYLESRFTFSSPSLVLGLKRVETTERHREAAVRRLEEFAQTTCALLPMRVAPLFRQSAIRRIREAAEASAKVGRLTLAENPDYKDEEIRQIEILKRAVDVPLKIVLALRNDTHLVKNLTSFSFLAELARLERIPVDLSHDLFRVVAGSLGVDEETLRNMYTVLRENVVIALMKYLFVADDDPAENRVRRRQYEALVEGWLRHDPSVPRELVRLVDDAANFYPQEVIAALQGHGPAEAALPRLREWHSRYPALGGLALHLARLLIDTKRFDEAIDVLRRTHPQVLAPSSERLIAGFLIQLYAARIHELHEAEKYEEALSWAIEAVALDDCRKVLVQNLLALFAEAAQRTQRDPGEAKVRAVIEDWKARARARAQRADDDEPMAEGETPLTEADFAELSEYEAKAFQVARQFY